MIIRTRTAKHSKLEYDQILNDVISYGIDPNMVGNAIASTVDTIEKVSLKSIIFIKITFALLKLPTENLTAVKEGKVTVSQGYIFAANLDNPGPMETFKSVLEKPMTNASFFTS